MRSLKLVVYCPGFMTFSPLTTWDGTLLYCSIRVAVLWWFLASIMLSFRSSPESRCPKVCCAGMADVFLCCCDWSYRFEIDPWVEIWFDITLLGLNLLDIGMVFWFLPYLLKPFCAPVSPDFLRLTYVKCWVGDEIWPNRPWFGVAFCWGTIMFMLGYCWPLFTFIDLMALILSVVS